MILTFDRLTSKTYSCVMLLIYSQTLKCAWVL